MVTTAGEQIWVWLDDPVFGPPQRIGTLSRGDRGSVRFAYAPDWLKRAHVFPLDPELDLTAGEFYPGNANFGVFMDSCPDRWGQVLIGGWKRSMPVNRVERQEPWDHGSFCWVFRTAPVWELCDSVVRTRICSWLMRHVLHLLLHGLPAHEISDAEHLFMEV